MLAALLQFVIERHNPITTYHGHPRASKAATPQRAARVHPHLHALKHSRDATECSTQEPDIQDPEDPDTQDPYLPSRRHNLHTILNSERWTYHKTLNNMRLERERLMLDIEFLMRECSAWTAAWHVANSELLRCQSLRLEQAEKLREVSCELHKSKTGPAVRINPTWLTTPCFSANTG